MEKQKFSQEFTIEYEGTNRILSCNQCDYKSKKKSNMLQHIKVKHCGIRDFECNLCSKAFTSKYHLETHQEIKHLNVRWPCTICEISYCTRDKLLSHCKKEHNGNTKEMSKAYQCLQCGKMHSTKRGALKCPDVSGCKPNSYSHFVQKTVKTTVRKLHVASQKKATASNLTSIRVSQELSNCEPLLVKKKKKRLVVESSDEQEETEVSFNLSESSKIVGFIIQATLKNVVNK